MEFELFSTRVHGKIVTHLSDWNSDSMSICGDASDIFDLDYEDYHQDTAPRHNRITCQRCRKRLKFARDAIAHFKLRFRNH